jgi:hypothetical protein
VVLGSSSSTKAIATINNDCRDSIPSTTLDKKVIDMDIKGTLEQIAREADFDALEHGSELGERLLEIERIAQAALSSIAINSVVGLNYED